MNIWLAESLGIDTHLYATLTQKLITSSKRYLNDSTEFRKLTSRIIFDIGNALHRDKS